jgi:hypothetical protein
VDAPNEGGFSNELPWSSVFDPTANVQAFSKIQAAGFRAASELVERFVRIAATGLDKAGGFAAGAPPSSEQRGADLFGATGLEPLVSSWWAMADQFLRPPAQHGAEPAPLAGFDLTSAQATGQLALDATAGSTAAGEVWLHNRGPVDMGKVALRCSDLLAHDGASVSAEAMRFQPDMVLMPARCSRGVTVELDVGDDVAPGRYRGTLLADGQHDLWLPVVLMVGPLGP